jgi:sporulation protein YlmC with PRC-barrel domain
MKKTYKKALPWMAALCCLTLTNGFNAAADDDSTKVTRTTDTTTTTTEGAPLKANKASSFIGMDIKNQSGEQLGHIKDLVFDLKSQRVAYAVMSTAPKALLGINEKLLAVPLNAFALSSDEKYLVLNADKAKVEAAAGIDKNNWPSVSNPSWGAEPFWKTTEGTGTYTPGTTDRTLPRTTQP